MINKKIIGSIAVLAIAAITAFNVNVNTQETRLSDVSLDNVEALASESSAYFCLNLSGCRFDINFNCHVYYNGSLFDSCPLMRGF